MNIFNSIRKSRTVTTIIAGMFCNIIVFAEPATRALANLSTQSGFLYSSITMYSTQENRQLSVSSSGMTPEIKTISFREKVERNIAIQIDAKEKTGDIGIEDFFAKDYIHDNFFHFFIPDSLDLSQYYTILTYELFGVLSEEGTTKSINGSIAYGGKIREKDESWKKVEEYIPNKYLKNGTNELFFNRYTDSIYGYKIKNVSLKFFDDLNDAVVKAQVRHEKVFSLEEDLTSTLINLADSDSFNRGFYGISLMPFNENFQKEAFIKISGLPFKDVKPLGQDLFNVTGGGFSAYRLEETDLPTKGFELHLAYDYRFIPDGYSHKDIRTYFFDKVTKSWKALPIVGIDVERHQIVSLVSDPGEGVDYINGIIKVPEQPETANFVPTTIKDMEFANPSAGVVSIPPPIASQSGALTTSFPIKLPPGRNGMEPSLEVSYNSEGGNGWMGMGWNLETPSITVNTKWGVPVFDGVTESEVYSLNGQDLVFEVGNEFTAAHRNPGQSRSADRLFYLRKEGNYLTILRHGNHPSNYWWEVTDKVGNKSFYGGYLQQSEEHVLRKGESRNEPVVHWALVRQQDPYGNYIQYNYDKKWQTLSNGIKGWSYYLENIKYTLHTSENVDFYKVDFILNDHRTDVITSARRGMMEITNHLLESIVISFKDDTQDQIIRRYRFDYSDASFGKKHLNRISEYDSEDRLFYSNSLEYFETDENDIISDVVENWSGSHDDVSSVLENIATGGIAALIPSGSVLGTSVSSGFSSGMRVGVGVGVNTASVANTIGGSFNYQASNQESRISFMDINGDGLPDKIYTNSSRVYYRPNTGNGFGDRIQIIGINSLDKTKSRTNGFGVDANLMGLVGVGASTSRTKSLTDHYFVDINGDGLPDMISNNRVKFNTTRANSDPSWRSFSYSVQNSENPIEAGLLDPDMIGHLELESLEELRALHPQFDHVKVWEAPYSGNISISGTAQLLEKNVCNRSEEPNDFRITIERSQANNSIARLIKSQVLTDVPVQVTASIMNIQKGDFIFFRIHNKDYGCGGEAEWNPIINYTSGTPSGNDEQGKPYNLYKAKEDFIMNYGGGWEPESEEYTLSGYFNLGSFNPYQFSDDVDFIVERIVTDITTGESWVDVPWTKKRVLNHETGFFDPSSSDDNFSVNLTPVGNLRYSLHFYARSDSNVSWDEINWRPSLYGNQVYFPPISYRSYDNNIHQSSYRLSANELPGIANVIPGEEMDSVVVISHNLFSLPSSRSDLLMIYLNALEARGELPLRVNWLVKEKSGAQVKSIYKRSFYLIENNGSFVFSQSPSSYVAVENLDKEFHLTKEYIYQLQQNQGVLYSAFFVENRKAGIFDRVEIVFQNHPDAAIDYPMSPKIFRAPMMAFSPSFYGLAHRGWGQFLYNGGLDFTLNEEGDLQVGSSFEGPIDMGVFLNIDPDIDPDDVQQQIDNLDPNEIEINGEVVRYTLYNQNNENRSFENLSVKNSLYAFNQYGSLTTTLGRFGENDLYDIYIDENDLLNQVPDFFLGLKQLTNSKGTAISGELITVSGTESKSTSNVLNQYIDLNGDRYPDIITKEIIQFTGMNGGLSNKKIMNSFVSGSKNFDETIGVTIASMKPNSDSQTKSENPIIINTHAGMNGGSGSTSDIRKWYDMNGDGLPDQVIIRRNNIGVRLNTGYGFSDEVIWAVAPSFTSSSRENLGVGVPFPTASFAFGFGGGTSTAEMQTILMDVNGDGLPDLIRNNGFEYNYYLNNGNGIDMSTPFTFCQSPSIERDFSISGNIYSAMTFGFSLLFLKITFSPSVGADASFSEKVYAIQDIDGDGLPDLLYKQNGNGSVNARLNQLGKAHLLKKVNTPLGGSWEVDYVRIGNTYDMPQSKWVMSELKTFNGFSDGDFILDKTFTKFSYENGNYDRRERDFYGFETVRTDQCLPDDGSTLRYTIQRFHNNNYYLAGKLKEKMTYSADNEKLSQQRFFYNIRKPDVNFSSEMNTPLEAPYIESGVGSLDETRVITPLVKSIVSQYEEGGNLHSISEYLKYDGYGNMTKFKDPGTGGNDAYFATIKYDSIYYRGLPTEISISAVETPTVPLRKREAIYNNFGKLEQVVTKLNETDENRVTMNYDNYGNLNKIIQENNLNLIQTEPFEVKVKYDDKVHTYPIEVSDSYNQTSKSVYDYFFGLPVLQTDSNGNSIRIRIDQRGRDIEIAGPYEYNPLLSSGDDWIIRKQYPGELAVAQQTNGAGPADYRISSAVGEFEAISPGMANPVDAEHSAHTLHKDPLNPGNEFRTLGIVDGFGQAIQLKKSHFMNGSTLVWQVSGKEKKDALGRIIEQYLPTTESFSVQNTNYVPGTAGLPVIIDYDDKDRQTRIQQPGENNATIINYSLEENMMKTEVINENYQTQTTFMDVRGRIRKTVQNEELATMFFYNAINEQIKLRTHNGSETHYFYDLAGRRVTEQHPDRGTTHYTYDKAGRLIHKETANSLEQGANHATAYKYDFGRLMEINYPDHPENNVIYEYGSGSSIRPIGPSFSNVGRITVQKDATGVQFFNYGKLGELVQQKRGVAVAGKTFYWFETNWEYDSWGRIKKIIYPDNEKVFYGYDPAGQLKSIDTDLGNILNRSVPTSIVKEITYTEFGERKSITYGNNTINTYDYDNRRRLNKLKHEFSAFAMERHYQYDPLSNIIGISSFQATHPSGGALGGPVEHTYLYDNYNRLTHAEGYYVGPDDEVPDMLKQAYSLEMEYDLSHNILEKNQLHQFGSVTSVNQSLPATARHAQTSYRLEYSGYGTATYAHRQPHAPRMITEYPQEDYSGDPEDPRIKRKHIAYDANGNQLEIKEEVKDPSDTRGYRLQSLRKNLWDAEDRLLAVDLDPESDEDKPLVAIYTYDAGGERTIKYVPARIDSRYSAKESGDAERLEAMIYPNALVTAKVLPIPPNMLKEKDLKVVKYTKHYYIGSERIASFLGTKRGMGLYCGGEPVAVQDTLNSRVIKAGEALERVFDYFEKTIDSDAPFLYGPSSGPVCGDTHVPEELGTYWYHPDHLGSSSYITNLDGEISQHMEYLPFGETLVEEHLNSNNSPYKFNAKEFDAETGNYYYGARYYDPKWSIWLSVDPLFAKYPTLSPYIYTAQNPVIYVDPDGARIVNADRLRLNKAKTYLNRYNNQLSEFNGMSRRELRNKGLLEKYKDLKSRIRVAKSNVKTYKTRAKKTDMIMAKWKKESPNLYNKIDNMEVDLHLGVDGNRLSDEVFGAAAGPLCIDGEYQYVSDIGENALDVFINSGVNISHKDEETGEYSLNHEGGHFIFAVENPIQYEEDKINIEARGEDYKGGHHPAATTGKTAREYGSKKDINNEK